MGLDYYNILLLLVVRRFHSLRSFHQRLLKINPLWGPEDDEGLCKSVKAPYIITLYSKHNWYFVIVVRLRGIFSYGKG